MLPLGLGFPVEKSGFTEAEYEIPGVGKGAEKLKPADKVGIGAGKGPGGAVPESKVPPVVCGRDGRYPKLGVIGLGCDPLPPCCSAPRSAWLTAAKSRGGGGGGGAAIGAPDCGGIGR